MRISFLYHEFFAERMAAGAAFHLAKNGCRLYLPPARKCGHVFNTAAGISILA